MISRWLLSSSPQINNLIKGKCALTCPSSCYTPYTTNKSACHSFVRLCNYTFDLLRLLTGNNKTFAVESADSVVALQVSQFTCHMGPELLNLQEPGSDRFFNCNTLPGKAYLDCFMHLLVWQAEFLTSHFNSLIFQAKTSKNQTLRPVYNLCYEFPRQTWRWGVNCVVVCVVHRKWKKLTQW